MVSLLAALPSLATRFESLVGLYMGCEAFWFTESEARDMRIKSSVAISDMALVVTRLIHEIEAAIGGDVVSKAAASSLLPLAQDMRILRTFKMACLVQTEEQTFSKIKKIMDTRGFIGDYDFNKLTVCMQ
ncbi:hypothetical protein LPJ81_004883 [Coemansia sp. IMI 209127]|nr:hypothetical protein LPJ81_004883 [Coemansia sp. IMI 209127]